MNPGFLFLFLHSQSRLQFLDCARPTWASQPDWMPGWRFSAILPTSPLYSTSSFWTTVVRVVELSAVLTRASLFAPAAFFPGCGHEKSPVFLLHPTRFNDSHLSPQISHFSSLLSPDHSWTTMASWTIRPTGFDSDHLRSPLRANLESLDRLGILS